MVCVLFHFFCFYYRQKDHQSPQKKPNVSAAENVADATKSDMDTCGGLAVENAPKGWVIGPLFQSFKSKMASFTEIVMSPVKLFTANSPPPFMDHLDKPDECEADGTSDFKHSEPRDIFHPEAQSENGNQERLSEVEGGQNVKTVALKYSKRISFDEELPTHSSEQVDGCAVTQKENNSVPLQHSPSPCFVSEEVSESVVGSSVLLQPSDNVSASHESTLKLCGATEDQKGKVTVRLKPQPRKCTANRRRVKKVTSKTSTSEVQKEESEVNDEHMNSVKSNTADSVCYAQPNGGDGDDDDGRKTESLVCQSLQNNLNDNGRTLEPSLDTQQLECQVNPGRAKRALKLDCNSQDFVKRKRLAADKCTENTKNQELLNVASDDGILRPPRKEIVSTCTIVEEEEMLKPARRRPAVTTRANKKGKGGQETLATINENTQAESSSDAMLVCTLDKISGVSEGRQKSSRVKPSGSCKRPKTTGLGQPDVNIDNGMDLETTVAITSTKQAEQEPLSEVLVHPGIKQLQRNINMKPRKRKSPVQASSETDSSLVSTSPALSMEPLELTPTDFNTSEPVQKEESLEKGLNQPSKRPKKGLKGAVKSSSGSQETKHYIHNLRLVTKENQPKEGKISTDPVYFEMTPFESNPQPVPSPSQLNLDCYIQLDNEVKHIMDGSTASVSDEVSPPDTEASDDSSISRLRSSARRINMKPRRADNQRRKCRVLNGRTRKGVEVTSSVTMDNADLATASSCSSGNGLSKRLLRSYSCPEIPSFRPHDSPWTSSLHSTPHSRTHTPHQPHNPVHHAHKFLRRARRHTVSSVEVEREIAPLCLRKEVYPSRRSLPYDGATQRLSPSLALSPSTSLSALASCFLSSPLAFLSKKVDSRGAAASTSTSSHVSSPTSSSSSSIKPLIFLQRADISSATLDYSCR